MRTSRLVYAETVHILYSQRFVFADTEALFNFASLLGPVPCGKLRDIEILGWTDKLSITSQALPAFAMLQRLVNLDKLRISCSLGRTQDWAWVDIFPPKRADSRPGACHKLPADILALKVYRDCYHWLRFAYAQGGMRAIRHILRIDRRNFWPSSLSSPKPMPPFTRQAYLKMRLRFWAYLEILLTGNVM